MQTRNRQFVSVLIGAFIYAVSMVSLVKPVHIAPGGATGVALMLNYLFGLPVGAMSFFVNVPLLAAAWKTLGPRFVLKTTATVLLALSSWTRLPLSIFLSMLDRVFWGLFWAAPFQALA